MQKSYKFFLPILLFFVGFNFIKADNFIHKKKFAIGTALFTVGSYYAYKLYRNFVSLESNPLKELKNHNKLRKQFNDRGNKENWDQIKNANELISKYRAAVKDFEKKNPIFLLGECQLESSGSCRLSRSYNGLFRKSYEDRIVSMLSDKLTSSFNKPLELTSFGSGGLFQDLIVLIKILKKKPNAHINFHAIDIQYDGYVMCRDWAKNTRQIKFNYFLNIDSIFNKVIEYVKNNGGTEEMAKNSKKDLSLDYCVHECKFQQFISYIYKRFPLAKVALYVHENSDGYLKYIKSHGHALPDIIFAADIDIGYEMRLIHEREYSPYEYLCLKILQEKPTAKNLLLGKKYFNQARKYYTKVKLSSLYLKNKNNCTPHTIKLTKSKAHTLYLEEEIIPDTILGRLKNYLF